MKHAFFSLLYTGMFVFEKMHMLKANIQKKGVLVSNFYFFKTLKKSPNLLYFSKNKFAVRNLNLTRLGYCDCISEKKTLAKDLRVPLRWFRSIAARISTAQMT